MERIVSVTPQSDWRLEVVFSDGTRGVISLKDRLFGPVFEPLIDPQLFSQARVDEFGAICWPNGADLASEAVHDVIRRQRVDDVGGVR